MTFLAGLAAQLLEWLLTKLGGAIVSLWQKLAKRSAIEDSAKESVQPLKDAKTGEEIDNATKDTLGGI